MNRKSPGEVRIIAGQWRGRKLPVVDVHGLRPSGDRTRETLFNWLQPVLPGSRCVDLFAGTGALGFEAASRGASSVVLVERDRTAASMLKENALRLGAEQVSVVAGDALGWLRDAPASSVDIAFLDPPFGDDLASSAFEALLSSGVLADGAQVYVETAVDQDAVAPIAGWRIRREKRVGKVRLQLLVKIPD